MAGNPPAENINPKSHETSPYVKQARLQTRSNFRPVSDLTHKILVPDPTLEKTDQKITFKIKKRTWNLSPPYAKHVFFLYICILQTVLK